MELKSLSYVAFCLAVIILYYLAKRIPKGQRSVLLIANCILILSLTRKTVLLLIVALCAFVFFIGKALNKAVENKQKGKSRVFLYIGLAGVIGLLCYFKFFKDTYVALQQLLALKGIGLADLIVPVGISYYSLSLIAYLLDIYHKKLKPETNFLDFVTFVTFFPSIVEGPINLYKKVAPQLTATHDFDPDNFTRGFLRLLWGYFKKVVIADRIGILVMGILTTEGSAGFTLFWAMVLYSFQIYTDFSGGIDVIMGVAEALDIKLSENFKAPLCSKSVTEYWQRWHMSLGEFMEKYIYYPIVLNRSVMKFSKKIKNSYMQKVFSATLASIIVFVIVGIWHGTGWNYVVYGCYQAVFVSTAVLLGPVYKSARSFLHIDDKCVSYRILTCLRTFVILTFGRYFIKARDLNQTFELFRRTFTKWNAGVLFDGSMTEYGLDFKNLMVMYLCILLIIVTDILYYRGIKIRDIIMKQDVVFRFTVYLAAIFAIVVFGIYGAEFTSASFIYQGF